MGYYDKVTAAWGATLDASGTSLAVLSADTDVARCVAMRCFATKRQLPAG